MKNFYLETDTVKLMDSILDELPRLRKLDRGGMLEVLSRFPEDCRSAVVRGERVDLSGLDGGYTAVVFAGVGGSSIGGRLIMDWLWEESKIPLCLSRGCSLPAYVDEGVLVFVVSYSGDTEETLSMLQEAIDIGAPVVTVTSGGRMAEISEEKGIPMIPLPEGVKPRAALPHQFLSLAVVLHKLNLLGRSWDELGEAFLTLETLRDEIRASVPVESNTAKRTAARLVDKVPLVYGSRLLEGVAYRFGTQLNENSKVPSGSGSFPEVFHNAVVGSEANRGLLSRLAMVIFRDLGDSESVGGKIDRFIELFAPRVGGVIELESRGEGRLSRMMSLIYLGDYISTYLGLLYGIDPSSNRSIDELKRV